MHRTNPIRLAALALAIAMVSACRDAPVDPTATDLTLRIQRGDVPFEEETIAPGGTLQLNAKLYTSTGSEQNASGLSWSSTDDDVATVDAAGRVTAVAIGTTRIIVRAGVRADTGQVNVRAPVTGAIECAPGDPGLSLAVGEAQTFTGEDAVDLCVTGGVSGQQYLLMPFNASLIAGARLDAHIVASAPVAPSTSLSPSLSAALTGPLREGPMPDERFHELHLDRSRAEFEPALRLNLSPAQIAARAVPSVGALMDLNAGSLAGSGCANPDYRTGRVVAISDRAIVVADTTNPSNGFTPEHFATIADTFDDLIWDVNTGSFGEPTDIDENGRVIIFYTRAVNELTSEGADSYVGGFFYNRDLFPTTGTNPCAGSNAAEMFYMLVPDPTGEVNNNVRGTQFVLDRTFSVLAHEFQHLINDSRRLYVNKAMVWEDSWLNEGLSHIAEELAFYAASEHAPKQNLGTSAVVGSTAAAFNRYNIDNFERYIRYLREPENHSVMGSVNELATRGAAWAFLRYVADREPGDDQAMWTRLVNSKTMGLQNLEEVLGVNPRDWMHDWQVSVYTDDADFEVNGVYSQPSWNFRLLTEILDPSGRFPLRTRGIGPTTPAIQLDGGSAAFIRVSLPGGTRQAVRTTVNDLPPPSRLRLTVVRIR